MQATTPASVNHVPAWLVVASALRSLLIRFSHPSNGDVNLAIQAPETPGRFRLDPVYEA